MLIYNTTYHIEEKSVRNFIIWLQEHYIMQVLKTGMLHNPRLTEVLSNKEEGSSSFSLQFEVEDSKTLHSWYSQYGIKLNEELVNIFKNDVVGFPTLLETVELPDYD